MRCISITKFAVLIYVQLITHFFVKALRLHLVVQQCSMNRFFFFSSRRRHTRLVSDWSSDVCSSDLASVRSVGFSPDGQMLASCGNGQLVLTDNANPDGTVIFWNTKDWTEKGRFKAPAEIGRASCRERV